MAQAVEPIAPASHRKFVLTPWSAQRDLSPPSIERAEGVFLYDDGGRRYLDLSAGLVCVNLGHGHPKVTRAIAEQAQRLCYVSPALFNSTRAELARRLAAISPWAEGCRTFFTTGGGEANEDAMKIARMVTGRLKILSAFRSFHGSAPGAGSLTGDSRRWFNEPGMPGIVHFLTPYPYRSPFDATDPATETRRALEHLELVLGYEDPKRVAAIIIEPVVGSNGVIVYPEGYLAGLRAICDRHGILLIFDEVMTGFGRVGAAFASLRFGVTPDIITFAKGSTSAYMPLGGAMVRERVAAYFDDVPLGCGHTYSGHPLATATALAVLDAYESEGLFARALEIETWLRDGLGTIARNSPLVGDVRGIGAMFGVELVSDRETRAPLLVPPLLGRLRELGVYAFGRSNIIHVTPPLTIERDELALGFAALETALAEMS